MRAKIAAVQFKTEQYEVERNISKAERAIRGASSKAELILFPEQFLTGPIGNRLELADLAKGMKSAMSELARKHSVFIAAGSIVEKTAKGLRNRAYLFGKNGEELAHYDKMALWKSEASRITPGEGAVVVQTPLGRIGFAICWDLTNAALFEGMRAKSADMILCPSIWWRGMESKGKEHDPLFAGKYLDALCLSQAYRARAAILYANYAGSTSFGSFSDESIGHTQLTMPFRGKVACARGSGEQILYCEADTKACDDAREYFSG